MSRTTQRVHFIAIGGSVMHSLAIALKSNGFLVSGSDDEIYEPSKSRLRQHGLLPTRFGWDPDNITPELDAVILGMHAKEDNPELWKARKLGLNICSFPEYIRQQSNDKQRIVIAGSHGKTTITAIVMHTLKYVGREFDYVVGAHLDGFDNIVKLSDAPIIVIEGDEYFSSALDNTPKFLKYEHHIGLISGIAWDHINAYETIDDYVRQFEIFADSTPKAGTLIFCEEDDLAMVLASNERIDVNQSYYSSHPYEVIQGQTDLITGNGHVQVNVFGRHNMLNINGAKMVLARIGVPEEAFYEAIRSFEGASKRLQLISQNDHCSVFLDFAHAPSKVQATTQALKEKYEDRKLTACLELHTYSSLNKKFISNYQDTLHAADRACVYFNPKNQKQQEENKIGKSDIEQAFNIEKLNIFTDEHDMERFLTNQQWKHHNLLMMTSGHFGNLDLKSLADHITQS